ncbi:MAG: hypothetical protein Q9218_008170 [Villophora microphyllina]
MYGRCDCCGLYREGHQVAATATIIPAVVTTVTTSTSTVQSCTPTPPQCGNQGIEFAYYPNNQGDNNDPTYSNFNPDFYKTQTPTVQGTTSTVGGIQYDGQGTSNVYGTTPAQSEVYFALNHQGYIFAKQTGIYTLTASKVDDTVFVWLGPNAQSGWQRANENLLATVTNGQYGSGVTTRFLNEGDYLPFRIVFAQAQTGAAFAFSVTAPDRNVFLSSTTPNSPYVMRYSCDSPAAPAYPPFGQES